MKLRDFGILCDQNIAPTVAQFFRQRGFDLAAIEQRRGGRVTDSQILARATAEGRVVVTHDSDFGKLACLRGEPALGILFIRPGDASASKVTAAIDALLQHDPELTTPFVIVLSIGVRRCRIRIRRWAVE